MLEDPSGKKSSPCVWSESSLLISDHFFLSSHYALLKRAWLHLFCSFIIGTGKLLVAKQLFQDEHSQFSWPSLVPCASAPDDLDDT